MVRTNGRLSMKKRKKDQKVQGRKISRKGNIKRKGYARGKKEGGKIEKEQGIRAREE